MRVVRAFILILMWFNASCQKPVSQDYKSTVKYLLEFDGFKDNFYGKYNLFVEVSDPAEVDSITYFINSFESDYLRYIKPAAWSITISAIESDENSRYIGSLVHSTFDNSGFHLGRIIGPMYTNKPLENFLRQKFMVDSIEAYQGRLDQAAFEEHILQVED